MLFVFAGHVYDRKKPISRPRLLSSRSADHLSAEFCRFTYPFLDLAACSLLPPGTRRSGLLVESRCVFFFGRHGR
jgi:hypothetical protein